MPETIFTLLIHTAKMLNSSDCMAIVSQQAVIATQSFKFSVLEQKHPTSFIDA